MDVHVPANCPLARGGHKGLAEGVHDGGVELARVGCPGIPEGLTLCPLAGAVGIAPGRLERRSRDGGGRGEGGGQDHARDHAPRPGKGPRGPERRRPASVSRAGRSLSWQDDVLHRGPVPGGSRRPCRHCSRVAGDPQYAGRRMDLPYWGSQNVEGLRGCGMGLRGRGAGLLIRFAISLSESRSGMRSTSLRPATHSCWAMATASSRA